MMNTIIFPTDFSSIADNALHYAIEIARRTQARLLVLHAYHVPVLAPLGGTYTQIAPAEDIEKELRERLEDHCRQLRENYPDINFDTRIISGLLVDVLPGFARETGADLIIMGSEGASGVRQALVGTHSAEVLAEATCPVLVVPVQAHFHGIEQIVFATDLISEPSPDMRMVVDLARLFDAEISFVYVPINGQQDLTEDDWRKFYQGYTYNKVSFHVQEGSAVSEGLEAFCTKMAADLIVMINHRRKFWDELFVVSQTKQMAYQTHIPLLAIHDSTASV